MDFPCDLNEISCLCGSLYRSETAACEEVTCSSSDKISMSGLINDAEMVLRNVGSSHFTSRSAGLWLAL